MLSISWQHISSLNIFSVLRQVLPRLAVGEDVRALNSYITLSQSFHLPYPAASWQASSPAAAVLDWRVFLAPRCVSRVANKATARASATYCNSQTDRSSSIENKFITHTSCKSGGETEFAVYCICRWHCKTSINYFIATVILLALLSRPLHWVSEFFLWICSAM